MSDQKNPIFAGNSLSRARETTAGGCCFSFFPFGAKLSKIILNNITSKKTLKFKEILLCNHNTYNNKAFYTFSGYSVSLPSLI